MSDSRISRLPKWAQAHIDSLEARIRTLEGTIAHLRKINDLLALSDWVTLPNPPNMRAEEDRKIFYLEREGAVCIGSLQSGDCLVRARLRPIVKEEGK